MRSSLYIGSTGLRTHGEGMGVIANNLANINTVGYKRTQAIFQDLVSQHVTAPSNGLTNFSQKGAGARVGDVRRVFTEGGLHKSDAVTDISIGGKGFFGVTKDNEVHYTRAGNLHFTKDGRLVDPNDWTLLGHKITNGKADTTATPIQLNLNATTGIGYMPAKATSKITLLTQLGGVEKKNSSEANPYFSMTQEWDSSKTPPLGRYSYAEPVQFIGQDGATHQAMMYYNLAEIRDGQKAIEYVLAVPPKLDGSALADTKAAGLLMAGTMSFSSTGTLQNVTAFTPPASGNPADLANWKPASLQDGYPAFTVTPKDGTPQTIALAVGLKLAGSASGGLASAAEAVNNPEAIFKNQAGATRDTRSSTCYGKTTSNVLQQQNGYTEGFIRDLEIKPDGTVIGRYSNQQSENLYRISLYRFVSEDGLKSDGNNHFLATKVSGIPEEGIPGTENFGKIISHGLEQSNVDYSREITHMIITQRGFQMNSKVVTTTDQMLQKALEIKRA